MSVGVHARIGKRLHADIPRFDTGVRALGGQCHRQTPAPCADIQYGGGAWPGGQAAERPHSQHLGFRSRNENAGTHVKHAPQKRRFAQYILQRLTGSPAMDEGPECLRFRRGRNVTKGRHQGGSVASGSFLQ